MLSRRGIFAALAAPLLGGQQSRPAMFADAEAYQRFMGRWSELLAPLLVDFAEIPDTGRALDVGSGTGSLTFSIAAKKVHCEVVGIDPSKEYVSYAESKTTFQDRVAFHVGDAQDLQFPDAMFESSTSLLVFNFIPDRKRALREVSRVTKPGGYVSASVWDYAAGMKMLRIFWDAAVAVDRTASKFDEANMPLCRAGELSEFWKQEGLVDVKERPLDIVMQFKSFADYWDPFLLGQGPAGSYVQKLDIEGRRALREEVKRRISPDSEDAAFPLPARAWAVRGMVPRRA